VSGGARVPRERLFGALVRFALALQLAFLVAIVSALGVTVSSTPNDVRLLALAVVTPILVLTLLCIWLSWRRNIWGFAGAGALGAVGVGLRLLISTEPGLEIGGGLPVAVTGLYVVLGSLVLFTSLASAFQMRDQPMPG
jgi:hypothetical protein